MLVARPLIVDDKLWGTVYTLEFVNDVFPEHVHTINDNHITILSYGSVRCSGHPRYEGTVLDAKPGGTIVNWVAGEPHGFTALVDGTTLVNILKNR